MFFFSSSEYYFKKKLNGVSLSLSNERVTPPWYAVFRSVCVCGGGLDGTQYAKGRYAVRRHSVISYADINFYFQKVHLSSRNTTQVTFKVNQCFQE